MSNTSLQNTLTAWPCIPRLLTTLCKLQRAKLARGTRVWPHFLHSRVHQHCRPHTAAAAQRLLVARLPGRRPLHFEDEVVITKAVELVDGALPVLPVREVDEGKAARLACSKQQQSSISPCAIGITHWLAHMLLSDTRDGSQPAEFLLV